MKPTLVILFALLLVAAPAVAQDATPEADELHPLIAMMEWVPENAQASETIIFSYADYDAILSVGGNAPNVRVEADIDKLSDEEGWRFRRNLFRVNAGPSRMMQYLYAAMDEMPEVTGFSFFDFERGVEFGEPPTYGLIFEGDFDTDAITAAYTGRGFEEAEIAGLPGVCSEDGCDAGTQVGIETREVANPFGGDLGRREPLIILPELLVNSPSLEVLERMIAANSGEIDSLADNTLYAAAAEAITQPGGTLMQAMFVNQIAVSFPVMELPFFETPEAQEEEPEMGVLPQYLVVAFADRQEGDTQVAMIALVYADRASAEQAAKELPERLRTFRSIVTRRPDPHFIDRGATIEDGQVYQAADNRFVAIARMTYPLPMMEDFEDEPLTPSAGLIFRSLVQTIYTRDTAFLTVTQ